MRIELLNVNTNKLHDELIKAGIVPSLVESLNNITWVTVEDSQQLVVMAVVATHNPIPLPISKTELETIKDTQSQIVLSLVVGGLM